MCYIIPLNPFPAAPVYPYQINEPYKTYKTYEHVITTGDNFIISISLKNDSIEDMERAIRHLQDEINQRKSDAS